MDIKVIDGFKIIGLKIRTTNQDGKSAAEIGALWDKFIAENIFVQIPNKTSSEILSLYTNYEGDHTKPYDTIIGCKVSSLENIPEGMAGAEFDGGNYKEFTVKGNLNDGIIYEKWQEIFKTPMDRTYVADFDVFGEKAQDPTNAEVTILVGVN